MGNDLPLFSVWENVHRAKKTVRRESRGHRARSTEHRKQQIQISNIKMQISNFGEMGFGLDSLRFSSYNPLYVAILGRFKDDHNWN
jgi:hypothetical protein